MKIDFDLKMINLNELLNYITITKVLLFFYILYLLIFVLALIFGKKKPKEKKEKLNETQSNLNEDKKEHIVGSNSP